MNVTVLPISVSYVTRSNSFNATVTAPPLSQVLFWLFRKLRQLHRWHKTTNPKVTLHAFVLRSYNNFAAVFTEW